MKAETLRLRAMEPDDVEMLYVIENDTQLWACGDSTAPYSRATLRSYVENNANDIFQDRQLRLVIDIGGEPAGCVDLFHLDPMNRRAEVGIALLEQWRGCGMGRQAITQLLSFASEHLALHQLYAIVAESNIPALRLFASCGFAATARLKSWILRTPSPQDAIVFQSIG